MAGTLTISTLSDGTNSTSSTNCIQGSAKAWVNFDGSGTPVIRASYNVASVTKTSTGVYTVTFSTAMPDANYVIPATSSSYGHASYDSFTTSSFRFLSANATASGLADFANNHLAIFR